LVNAKHNETIVTRVEILTSKDHETQRILAG